jgi:hypothetical protein
LVLPLDGSGEVADVNRRILDLADSLLKR